MKKPDPMRRKSIGIFLNFPPSGGGTFQYGLCQLETLSQLKDQFDLLAIVSGEGWVHYCDHFKVPYVVIPHESILWRLLWKAWKLLRLPLSLWRLFASKFHPLGKLFHRQPERVWLFPSQDIIPAKFPIRGIVSVHDLMHIYEASFPEVGSWLERKRRNWNYQAICDYSKKILVDSPLGKKHLLENFQCPMQKVNVLPYTVPFYIRNWKPPLPEVKIPGPYFLYPAQLWEHKNHIRLLDAFSILVKENQNICLVLVGSSQNASQKVSDKIKTLGLQDRVFLLGYVSDLEMVALYKKAQALVFPTFFGPTNIPPLEALSLGCPVICSDIYAMREVLGDEVTYIDPLSSDSILDGMRAILNGRGKSGKVPSQLEFGQFARRIQSLLIETMKQD